jgi:hypothetical protein
VNDFEMNYFAKRSKLKVVAVGKLQILCPQLSPVQVTCSAIDNHFIQWFYKKMIL